MALQEVFLVTIKERTFKVPRLSGFFDIDADLKKKIQIEERNKEKPFRSWLYRIISITP